MENLKDYLIANTLVKEDKLELDLSMLLDRERFMALVKEGVSKQVKKEEIKNGNDRSAN